MLPPEKCSELDALKSVPRLFLDQSVGHYSDKNIFVAPVHTTLDSLRHRLYQPHL